MNLKSIVPNAVTLSNLLLGIISLVFTMNEDYFLAAIAIIIAMVLDGLDGKIARRLDVSSEFGKQLDSLCDLVSFGVAPALLVYSSILIEIGLFGLLICLTFALCGAIRLARFNVLNIKNYFVGIPITIAGSLLAFLTMFSDHLPLMIYPIMTIFLAFLMVSNIRVPKY